VYDLQRDVGNVRTIALLRRATLARDRTTEESAPPAEVKRYLEGRAKAAARRLTKAQIKILQALQQNEGMIENPENRRGTYVVKKRLGESDRIIEVVRQLQQEARTGVVTMRMKKAGVRSAKKFVSKPVATVQRGDKVTLLKKEGDWVYVRTTDGTEGWMNVSDLVLPPGMFPVQLNPEGWEHQEDDLEFKASPHDLPEGRYGEGTRALGED
jgi:hypothetical protein